MIERERGSVPWLAFLFGKVCMHILILGAGYAGVRVAIDLERYLVKQSTSTRVTLVDRYPYHQLVTLLHLTATAGIKPEDTVVPLQHALKHKLVQLRQAEVIRIAPLERQVFLADGSILAYDRLVIGLGGTTIYKGVPGASEYALPLRSYAEALRLRDHILARFAEAAQSSDPAERRILLTIAIVGGGYTGCQLAGELSDWVIGMAKEFNVPHDDIRIALVERSNLLLKQFGDWATHEAEQVFDRRRVSVYLNTNVERIEQGKLFVEGNRVLHAGTIVWAGGIQPPALLAESGLPSDEYGHVLVDRYLRVQDQPLIFAAGDCARIPGPGNQVLPSTASYALRQGEYLARAFVDELRGRVPRMYEPVKLGDLVSLGAGDAIGNPLGTRVFGQPAWKMKQAIEAWYLTTL